MNLFTTMYNRTIFDHVVKDLAHHTCVIIYGARQVGKTTLVRKILEGYGDAGKYINCDIRANRQGLNTQDGQKLADFVGKYDIVVIDEAQRVADIGINLKILIDHYPGLRIIATGSSSFTLANKINEPLTGRKITYTLFPLSVREILGPREKMIPRALIEKIMIFGAYPAIVDLDIDRARRTLQEITNDYLYKDIFLIESIKKHEIIVNLLKLLAFQIGNEVSYSELANKLGVHVQTVEKYIILLEQSFVIIRLSAFSSNLRNEIKKKDKIYFCDLGIRNSIINNFNALDTRNDVGALWENFFVIERIKYLHNNGIHTEKFFWRNYQQQEIDYLEHKDGTLSLFECKWNTAKKPSQPSAFTKAIGGKQYTTQRNVVYPTNVYHFI